MGIAEFVLDDLETDALTELVNIAVSQAAVSLREMVGTQVLLSVPAVAVVSRAQAANLINASQNNLLIAVRQAFQGDFSGSVLLIFPEQNSLELVRAVAGNLSFEDILELEQEAIAEIGNIVLNGCMAAIANLLHRSLTMSLPEIVRGVGAEFFEVSAALPEDIVLFIHINFSFNGREVRGYVAMIMDFVSLESLRGLIGEFIKRSTG